MQSGKKLSNSNSSVTGMTEKPPHREKRALSGRTGHLTQAIKRRKKPTDQKGPARPGSGQKRSAETTGLLLFVLLVILLFFAALFLLRLVAGGFSRYRNDRSCLRIYLNLGDVFGAPGRNIK